MSRLTLVQLLREVRALNWESKLQPKLWILCWGSSWVAASISRIGGTRMITEDPWNWSKWQISWDVPSWSWSLKISWLKSCRWINLSRKVWWFAIPPAFQTWLAWNAPVCTLQPLKFWSDYVTASGPRARAPQGQQGEIWHLALTCIDHHWPIQDGHCMSLHVIATGAMDFLTLEDVQSCTTW